MTTVLLRLTIALLLAIGVLSVSVTTGSAEPPPQSGQTQRYFPWIPHGEIISDPGGFQDSGPYYGLITVQNLEAESVQLQIYPTVAYGGVFASPVLTLDAYASATYNLQSIFVDMTAVSTGVLIQAEKISDQSPARIAAVTRTVSPSLPAHPAETTGAHITVSGYTSLSYAGVASTPRVIPIAQTNSNWNTLIRLTNFEEEDTAFATLTLREHGGGAWTQLPGINIAPGQTHTLNMHDLVPAGWIGSVNISSAFNVGAIAERVKNETNMLLINTSRSQAQSSTTQVAPLVFRNWNHWNTGIAVVNHGFQQNDLTVTYFSPEGGQVHVDTLELGDRQMDFIYLPAGDGQPFAGSAFIEGTQPFSAVVDEVKYFGEDLDTGHAMSYSADYLQAEPGQALALPLFRKGHPVSGSGDTSGIQIFNLFGQAEVEIRILDVDGAPALSEPKIIELAAHEGYTFYSLDIDDLPIGFTGSAIVRNRPLEDQNSGIYAVTNLVNYDVQFDGSTAFNTRRFESPDPEPIPPIIIAP
jgi:hypothetical protein